MATCHILSVMMATKFLNVMNEDVRASKDALENLNTRKSTSRRILRGMLSKNSVNLSQISALNVWENGVHDRSIRSSINKLKILDC